MESHPLYHAPGDADLEGLLEAKDQEITRLLGILREQAAALETLKTRQTEATTRAQQTHFGLQQELAQMAAEADKARALAYTHQQESSRLLSIQTALAERNKHLLDGLDSLQKQDASAQSAIEALTATLDKRIGVLEQLAQTQIQANTHSTEKAGQLTATILKQHEEHTRRVDAIVDHLTAQLNSRFMRWPLIAKTWLTSPPKQK